MSKVYLLKVQQIFNSLQKIFLDFKIQARLTLYLVLIQNKKILHIIVNPIHSLLRSKSNN